MLLCVVSTDMGNLFRATLFVLAASCSATVLADKAVDQQSQPWGYKIGEPGKPRQGNFCDHREAALEIADVFDRYGARTGFSALSNTPTCATRVHAVTPKSLIRQIEIKLDGGGSYFVNFIQVQASDGSHPVLVTTRRLLTD